MENFNYYSLICFEGDEEEIVEEKEENTEGNQESEKKFTQADLNRIQAKEKRKTQEAYKELQTQLEEARNAAQAGSAEREELELKIEELQRKTMSAEEIARQKEAKLQKKHQEELEETKRSADLWKTRYTETVITNEILAAANEHGAIRPTQIYNELRDKVKLTQKLDEDGKPTDSFEARVDFDDEDKNGKAIKLDLSVKDAVKRMKELPQLHGNLFEGVKSGGLGAGNAGPNRKGKHDLTKMTEAERYKLRKEDPAAYAAAMEGRG